MLGERFEPLSKHPRCETDEKQAHKTNRTVVNQGIAAYFACISEV